MTAPLRVGWTGDCQEREGSPHFQLDCKGAGFQREKKYFLFMEGGCL